jgi:mannitol/fructose-specific phosphotransferase system IIA component (Ntr-type)
MKNMESLIAPQSILFPLDTDDRSTAFEAMVEALVKDGKLPPDLRDLTLDALENRESRLTTAIGNHIALPHASVAGLPGVVTCVAGTTRGIDCQAPDKQPTRIFYMVLIPSDQYSTHLRAIAGVTRFFRQEGIVDNILQAENLDQFKRCFL